MPVYMPCKGCGQLTYARSGYCTNTPGCRKLNSRYGKKPDLERYPCPLCGYLTVNKRGYCTTTPECRKKNKAQKQKEHRKEGRHPSHLYRRALMVLLAKRENWICGWCKNSLPDDLEECNIDHIIPQIAVIIHEDWNLWVLHRVCDNDKAGQITDEALILACRHGISL